MEAPFKLNLYLVVPGEREQAPAQDHQFVWDSPTWDQLCQQSIRKHLQIFLLLSPLPSPIPQRKWVEKCCRSSVLCGDPAELLSLQGTEEAEALSPWLYCTDQESHTNVHC